MIVAPSLHRRHVANLASMARTSEQMADVDGISLDSQTYDCVCLTAELGTESRSVIVTYQHQSLPSVFCCKAVKLRMPPRARSSMADNSCSLKVASSPVP